MSSSHPLPSSKKSEPQPYSFTERESKGSKESDYKPIIVTSDRQLQGEIKHIGEVLGNDDHDAWEARIGSLRRLLQLTYGGAGNCCKGGYKGGCAGRIPAPRALL